MRRLATGLVSLACVVGLARELFVHFVREPIRGTSLHTGSQVEPLRPFLLGVPRVGYESDDPISVLGDGRHDSGNARCLEAQYALVPVVVAPRATDLPLVVASFREPAALDAALATGRYDVVARPTAGVALLRRR